MEISVGRKVRSGFAWASGARSAAQLATWSTTIIVMRLLAPADYGTVAMAMVFVAQFSLLGQLGLGPALVQAREISAHRSQQFFGLSILVNVGLWLTLSLAAPWIAAFFKEPQLAVIVPVLALQFIVQAFTVIPISILQRALDFRREALAALMGTPVAGLTTLLLAFLGYGVWALVLGNLMGVCAQCATLNFVAPFRRRPLFSFRGASGPLTFAWQFTAKRLLFLLGDQVDILIGGRLLGKEALGSYFVGVDFASMPVAKTSGVINQVVFPTFARLQQDVQAVSVYLLKAVRLASFVAFPALWGMSCIASELVVVLLGSKWEQAILPLRLVALVMPLRLLTVLFLPFLEGLGYISVAMTNVLIMVAVMAAAFALGVRGGVTGLAMAWTVALPVAFAITSVRSLRVFVLSTRAFVGALAGPLIASTAMYGTVELVRHVLFTGAPNWISLMCLVSVGTLTYLSVVAIADRRSMREFVSTFGLAWFGERGR